MTTHPDSKSALGYDLCQNIVNLCAEDGWQVSYMDLLDLITESPWLAKVIEDGAA